MVETKLITKNRKAFHEYQIGERFEAGIVLQGTEVKAVRDGKVNLSDGWVDITEEGEAILKQVHISPYRFGNIYNHEEMRPRKLLLKKSELRKLEEALTIKGYTIVPTQMYLKRQFVKLEVALAKGKQLHDKRESSKEKDAQRAIARALRQGR